MIKNNLKLFSLFFPLTLLIKLSLFFFLKDDIYFSSTFVDEKWVLEHLDGRALSLYVYSPGYVLFLKLYSLFFSETKLSVQIFQIVFSSLINSLIFLFLTKITERAKAFILALLPVIFAPVAIFSLRVLPAAIWPELLILSILFFYISIKNSNRYFYAGSILVVLASLMRPNLLILVPIIVLFFFYIRKKSMKAFTPLVLTLLFTGIIGVINYSESEEFIPLTANSGVNFFMGNNEFSDGIYMPVKGVRDEIGLQLEDSVRIYAENTGDKDPTMEKASKWWHYEGLRFLKENPDKAVTLYLRKTMLMFRNEEYSSSFSTDLILERTFLPLFGFSLLLGMLVFFLIMTFNSLTVNEKMFMISFLFFSFAGVVFFIIDSRYRLGFSVSSLAFTMILIARTDLKKIFENKLKFSAAAVSAVLIFSVTAFPKHKGNLYYPWYSLGNLYVAQESWDGALSSFSNSVKDNPDYSHAWNNLGMTYLILEKKMEAQKAFEKAVEIEPENLMFKENLKRSR